MEFREEAGKEGPDMLYVVCCMLYLRIAYSAHPIALHLKVL